MNGLKTRPPAMELPNLNLEDDCQPSMPEAWVTDALPVMANPGVTVGLGLMSRSLCKDGTCIGRNPQWYHEVSSKEFSEHAKGMEIGEGGSKATEWSGLHPIRPGAGPERGLYIGLVTTRTPAPGNRQPRGNRSCRQRRQRRPMREQDAWPDG